MDGYCLIETSKSDLTPAGCTNWPMLVAYIQDRPRLSCPLAPGWTKTRWPAGLPSHVRVILICHSPLRTSCTASARPSPVQRGCRVVRRRRRTLGTASAAIPLRRRLRVDPSEFYRSYKKASKTTTTRPSMPYLLPSDHGDSAVTMRSCQQLPAEDAQ